MKYFKPDEFRCAGVVVYDKMNPALLEVLDQIREAVGFPLMITSSYRTLKYNTKIGGSENSAHLRGNAVDISAVNSQARFQILQAALKLGITRLGIGKTFIHIDIDKELSNNIIWLY